MYMIAEVSQYVAVASFAEAWIEMQDNINNTTESVRRLLRGGVDWNRDIKATVSTCTVASFAEAWIEIWIIPRYTPTFCVASFAEAWIEIKKSSLMLVLSLQSPPSRRRGLKSFIGLILLMLCLTSPPSRRRGLKYCRGNLFYKFIQVASFAEAWIEIPPKRIKGTTFWSPPSRRRGLKSNWWMRKIIKEVVASFAEAWIEI